MQASVQVQTPASAAESAAAETAVLANGQAAPGGAQTAVQTTLPQVQAAPGGDPAVQAAVQVTPPQVEAIPGGEMAAAQAAEPEATAADEAGTGARAGAAVLSEKAGAPQPVLLDTSKVFADALAAAGSETAVKTDAAASTPQPAQAATLVQPAVEQELSGAEED